MSRYGAINIHSNATHLSFSGEILSVRFRTASPVYAGKVCLSVCFAVY